MATHEYPAAALRCPGAHGFLIWTRIQAALRILPMPFKLGALVPIAPCTEDNVWQSPQLADSKAAFPAVSTALETGEVAVGAILPTAAVGVGVAAATAAWVTGVAASVRVVCARPQTLQPEQASCRLAQRLPHSSG